MKVSLVITRWLYIAAFFCAFFGVGVIAISIPMFIAVENASTWPEVQGVVVSKERRASGGNEWVEITYEYEIDGERYQSNRLYPGSGGWQKPSVGANYSIGQVVTVYYDPSDPSNAALYRNRPGWMAKFLWSMIVLWPIPAYVYGRMIVRKLQGKTARWDLAS